MSRRNQDDWDEKAPVFHSNVFPPTPPSEPYEDELRKKVVETLQDTLVHRTQSLHLHPNDIPELTEDFMVLIKSHTERKVEPEWWITDNDLGEHVKLVGPFTTDSDANIARTFIEKTSPKTYWIERLPKDRGETA